MSRESSDMLDDDRNEQNLLGRRQLLRAGATMGFLVPILPIGAVQASADHQVLPTMAGLGIHPRADWAMNQPPLHPHKREAFGDVEVLVVHHSGSRNDYNAQDVPGIIRSFYDLHTGRQKGWPDVAYNFFVDRHGEIWEGRAGSLSGPMIGDATGGNQGFSQLCCFIGNHRTEIPSRTAINSMARLLSGLATAYDVDTTAGAVTDFISRGSNRWPRGTSVTVRTISGHRDLSRTECPGNAGYEVVLNELPRLVNLYRAPTAPSTSSSPPTDSAGTAGPVRGGSRGAAATSTGAGPTRQSPTEGADPDGLVAAVGGVGAIVGITLLAAIIQRRRGLSLSLAKRSKAMPKHRARRAR